VTRSRPRPRRVSAAFAPVGVAALTASLAAVALSACSSPGGPGAGAGEGAAITTIAPAAPAVTTTAAPAVTTTAASSGSAPGGATTTAAVAVRAGLTAIPVASSPAQYHVLYVKPDPGSTTEIPVAITRGRAGTVTLTDNRAQLPADRYRVATLPVDQPGDADGDGVDDLTELADPVGANPLNPAPRLDARNGAVIVPDAATFGALSYQGNDVARDSYLAGLEFMKFWIVGTNTAHPAVYFMNTNTFRAHPEFASAVGLPAGRGPAPGTMRGDVVWNPNGTAPDGSKGTYRFAFQPSDAYSFKEIAVAFELLSANMPFLSDNLLYYPFPQSALPLYQKEKALYDAYRVPVLVD